MEGDGDKYGREMVMSISVNDLEKWKKASDIFTPRFNFSGFINLQRSLPCARRKSRRVEVSVSSEMR